jgi:hypothetical protein
MGNEAPDGNTVITFAWDAVDRAGWQQLLAGARSGLQQAWSYGEAVAAGGRRLHRAVIQADGDPVGCLQLVERRILGRLPVGFLLRGPVWLDAVAGAADEAALLTAIRARLGRSVLVWAPERPAMRLSRPVITGYGTAWLDLAREPDALRRGLAADWRGGLKQAEAGPLTVRRLASATAIAWLLERNEAHRREVGYHGPGRRFLKRLAREAQTAGELALFLAFERAEPVAGVMLVRHGATATYEVGHTTPRGRELRATHLLLWRAALALRDEGVRWLDLGGIATDRSPGIARFKLGLGGEVAVLPGTFLVCGAPRTALR